MRKRKFPKNIIMEVLKERPKGLTFREIAKHSKMSRLTATKYIYELVGGRGDLSKNNWHG